MRRQSGRSDAARGSGSPRRTGPTAAGRSTIRSRWRRSSAGPGVDLIDCSSGGQRPGAQIPLGPGYQVPFAEASAARPGSRPAQSASSPSPTRPSDRPRRPRRLVLLARELLRDRTGRSTRRKELGRGRPYPPNTCVSVRRAASRRRAGRGSGPGAGPRAARRAAARSAGACARAPAGAPAPRRSGARPRR